MGVSIATHFIQNTFCGSKNYSHQRIFTQCKNESDCSYDFITTGSGSLALSTQIFADRVKAVRTFATKGTYLFKYIKKQTNK